MLLWSIKTLLIGNQVVLMISLYIVVVFPAPLWPKKDVIWLSKKLMFRELTAGRELPSNIFTRSWICTPITRPRGSGSNSWPAQQPQPRDLPYDLSKKGVFYLDVELPRENLKVIFNTFLSLHNLKLDQLSNYQAPTACFLTLLSMRTASSVISGMSYPTCPVDVLSVLPYSSPSPVVSQLQPISYSPSAFESWTSSCWLGLSSWRLSCSLSLSSCSLLLWCLQVFLLPEPLQVYISGLHLSSTSIWMSSGSGFSGSAE